MRIFSGFSRDFREFRGVPKILTGFPRFSRGFRDSRGVSEILTGFPRFSRNFLGNPRFHRMNRHFGTFRPFQRFPARFGGLLPGTAVNRILYIGLRSGQLNRFKSAKEVRGEKGARRKETRRKEERGRRGGGYGGSFGRTARDGDFNRIFNGDSFGKIRQDIRWESSEKRKRGEKHGGKMNVDRHGGRTSAANFCGAFGGAKKRPRGRGMGEGHPMKNPLKRPGRGCIFRALTANAYKWRKPVGG